MRLLSFLYILLVYSLSFVLGQDNAGTNVAPALQGCYNETRYVTRDYRPPSTINVLVELIRKIEDGNPSQDAREISYELLHRFRQDGIRRTSKDIDSSQGLPYSPKGWESYKNRVQLTKITPGNAINFNNNSLSAMQACSLHFMVSSSIEIFARADETCPQTIARYTSRLHKRQSEFSDTESSKSKCPIESGVIFTKWGAVKAGLVLAGIAAGYQSNPIRIENYTLQSEYASTIAGELSETALNQYSSVKTVGNKGGWNTTVEPKYYFLASNEKDNLYLTDAEIRGGLDGLYLALNIQNWKSKANSIKISQMLDLYYGRGVFNDSSRACNRRSLIKTIVSDDILTQQTTAFSKLLDGESQLSYTPKEENLPIMSRAAVDSLNSYLGNLNDLACSGETELVERVATDILIFIDTDWDYQIIQPLVSYLLENIDVNKYESSYTLFDGANCEIIVNKSRSILDFYEQYNRTQQDKYPKGFDYSKVVQMAEKIYKAKLDNETDLTGQSMIILMLPHTTPSSSQSDYVRTRREAFLSTLPDVRIIVGGSGSKTSYNDLVSSANNDIFTISEDTSDSQIKESGRLIIERLKKIPRSVVNPSCGSYFSNGGSGNFEITQYVEPSGVNYHKIAPNYFFEGESLKIKGQGFGSITVCTSRADTNPKANTTGSGTTCKTLNSDEMSVDISSYCTDETVTNCSPIYISVQGEQASSPRCTEKLCRFPDNIKYTINLEGVECSSSSIKIISSILLVVLLLIVGNF